MVAGVYLLRSASEQVVFLEEAFVVESGSHVAHVGRLVGVLAPEPLVILLHVVAVNVAGRLVGRVACARILLEVLIPRSPLVLSTESD